MNRPSKLDALFDLPLAERLRLAKDRRNRAAQRGVTLGSIEEVRRELQQRKAHYEVDPASGLSWDEVQRQMREP